MSTDRTSRSNDTEGTNTSADSTPESTGEKARASDEREPGRHETGDRRDVIVPPDLYRIVTVFSTLIAIVAVVLGFVVLDTATNRTLAAASEVNLPLALLGVGAIAFGAAVYAFASRFRTGGMGNANNDPDER